MALVGRGVLPADHERLDSIVELIFHHGLLGREVVDVHLVDLGRYRQLRNVVDLLGRRGVVDQLHHFGAKHHVAFGRCDIFAELERLLVDLADHALVVDHIVIGVLEAFNEAQPTAGDRHFLGARIAH